jgi:hypothetical protein
MALICLLSALQFFRKETAMSTNAMVEQQPTRSEALEVLAELYTLVADYAPVWYQNCTIKLRLRCGYCGTAAPNEPRVDSTLCPNGTSPFAESHFRSWSYVVVDFDSRYGFILASQ